MKITERLQEGELTEIVLSFEDLSKMNPSNPSLRIETDELVYRIFPDFTNSRGEHIESWFFEGVLRVSIPKERYLEMVEVKKPVSINLNLQKHLKNEGFHYSIKI